MSCLPLRARIFSDRLTAVDIAESVHNAYHGLGCDGLFLPLVDNLGIHFPVTDCVQALRKTSPVEFVAVDGAQALGHIPLQLADMPCDIFLAGCHKWLRAYQPLGLAFFGRRATSQFIEHTRHRLPIDAVIDDPLLSFNERLRTGNGSSFSETVNLSPLFTCHGALLDAETEHRANGTVRRQNIDTLGAAVDGTPWQVVSTDESLHSQIFMLHQSQTTSLHPDGIRRRFHEAQVAVTAYANGSVRISLPFARLTLSEQERLSAAFQCH